MGDVENETQNALPELGFKRKVFIFYEFLFEKPRETLYFEMPRETLYLMLYLRCISNIKPFLFSRPFSQISAYNTRSGLNTKITAPAAFMVCSPLWLFVCHLSLFF